MSLLYLYPFHLIYWEKILTREKDKHFFSIQNMCRDQPSQNVLTCLQRFTPNYCVFFLSQQGAAAILNRVDTKSQSVDLTTSRKQTYHMACTDTGLKTCKRPAVFTLKPLVRKRRKNSLSADEDDGCLDEARSWDYSWPVKRWNIPPACWQC